MRPVVIFSSIVGCLLLSAAVVAQYPNALLSPGERVSMLAERTNSAVWSRIQPRVTGFAASAPTIQNDYRARYRAASLGNRQKIAEIIGEEGVEQLASTRRLKRLLGPRGRSVSIGPDSIYQSRASGKVLVLEAKGGSSAPRLTYGSVQGTNTNTIRSAKGVLVSSAGMAEKLQAARVIKAAQNGDLQTEVVRTRHVWGTPLAPQRIGQVSTANVSREARVIQRELVQRNPELRPVFRKATIQHQAGRLTYLGNAMVPSGGIRSLSGVTATSSLITASGRGLQRAWQVGNRWMLPVGLGVAGVSVATYGYRFLDGDISQAEFIEASTDPAVFLSFTALGASIGAVSSFGIGVGPGAAIGSLMALPVMFFNDPEPSRTQQEAIRRALREHYQIAASPQLRVQPAFPAKNLNINL